MLLLLLLRPLYLLVLLQLTTASAAETPVVLDGESARFLYDFADSMSFSDDPRTDPDKVDFLGGCFFSLTGERLARLFCECSVGRINDPAALLKIVQPHLGFAPFPDFDDKEAGSEGRALGIEYNCSRTREGGVLQHRCELRDHYYIRK